MGRLQQLKPRLTGPRPRLSSPTSEADRLAKRDQTVEWRKWYKTARWQRLRWDVLVRDQFTCRRCHRIEGTTSLLVADHRIPHRGDPDLFWSAENLQCLCKTCHDSAKQAEERRGGWVHP